MNENRLSPRFLYAIVILPSAAITLSSPFQPHLAFPSYSCVWAFPECLSSHPSNVFIWGNLRILPPFDVSQFFLSTPHMLYILCGWLNIIMLHKMQGNMGSRLKFRKIIKLFSLYSARREKKCFRSRQRMEHVKTKDVNVWETRKKKEYVRWRLK